MSNRDRYLTTEEIAAQYRTVPATVRYWRHVGKGPQSFKVGRRVLYRESDVDAWADEQRTAASRDAVASAASRDAVASAASRDADA
jgi:predicted DNA-binding transcriptional regulator AlpA